MVSSEGAVSLSPGVEVEASSEGAGDTPTMTATFDVGNADGIVVSDSANDDGNLELEGVSNEAWIIGTVGQPVSAKAALRKTTIHLRWKKAG
jgi:hypothetical protein